MFTPPPNPRSRPTPWTAALTLHAAILAAILITGPQRLRVVDRPGTESGHFLALNYVPGGEPTVAAMPTAKKAPPQLAQLPKLNTPSLEAPTPQPAKESAHGGTQTGESTDALGSGGDIQIALTLVHPPPRPNIPPGTHGDVVVDVIIDKRGRITDSKLVRGHGPAIDSTVLATIQQWTFTPATRDGIPIDSEQELLFHYDRA
jgi:protein TonB